MKSGSNIHRFLATVIVASYLVFGLDGQSEDRRASPVNDSVRRILDAGLGEMGSVLRARAAFESAGQTYRDAPSVSYAWGLVLLRHHQLDEAAKQFLISAEAGDQGFLPSRKAIAWTLMINRKHGDALEASAALAIDLATRAAIADSNGEDPSETELASARWLGEFFLAARTTARNDSESQSVNSYLTRIESVFDGPLADAFSDGQAAFSERLEKLTAETESAQERAHQRLQRKKVSRA